MKDSDYETIRTNGIKRVRDFYPEIININKDYLLAFESGEIALNIPGTFEKFCLSKYRDELGKEYKNITLFLISQSDKFILEKIESNPFTQELDEYESPCEIDLDAVNQNKVSPAAAEIADDLIIIDPMESPPCKQAKRSGTPVDEDAIYAQSLQAFFNEEGFLPNLTESEIDQVLPSSFDSIIDDLRKHVCQDEQLFLNVRRNADLMRILSLWGRQKTQSPESRLMVRFLGESGIDSGALTKEFLTNTVKKIGDEMFSGGAPIDSMQNVTNNNYRFCGQIMAVSIVEGGPPPKFLDESVFYMLCNGIADVKSLIEENFSPNDRSFFNQIKKNPQEMSSLIIDNGFTGVINDQSIKTIIETMMVSIASKRRMYLEEVAEGLKIFGLYEKVINNQALMKPLFVRDSASTVVDAPYVTSLLQPSFSPDGSSKRVVEETFIDYLQDFLNDLEDSNIAALPEGEVVAFDDATNDDTLPYGMTINADLTPAGFLGWCTGQKHRPIFNEDLTISVEFDHDCYKANPGHTICFPIVSSCSRNLTLPTQHSKSYSDFKDNFLMAFSKGQAFGRT